MRFIIIERLDAILVTMFRLSIFFCSPPCTGHTQLRASILLQMIRELSATTIKSVNTFAALHAVSLGLHGGNAP